MVAMQRQTAPSARNVVRRTAPDPLVLVEARGEKRAAVALKAWVCGAEHSARGYALDLSQDGARFGGMGTRFEVGDEVIVKLELAAHEAPAVLKAEVVRYAPAPSCPHLCVRFREESPVDDVFRVEQHVRFLKG
jgi:hypothetical protein